MGHAQALTLQLLPGAHQLQVIDHQQLDVALFAHRPGQVLDVAGGEHKGGRQAAELIHSPDDVPPFPVRYIPLAQVHGIYPAQV